MIKSAQNSRKSAPYTPLVILVVIHLFLSNLHIEAYSVDRIAVFFILITMLFYAVDYKRMFNIANPFLLLMIYALLQVLFSPYIDTKFEASQQLIISISIIFYIYAYRLYDRRLTSLSSYLQTIVVINIVLIAGILIYAFSANTNVYQSTIDLFSNIRIFNHIQTISIPSLAFLLYITKDKWLSKIVSLLLFLNIFIMLDTGARGTMYAITISYFLFLITAKWNNSLVWHCKKILFILLLATSAFFIYFNIYGDSHALHLSNNSLSGRLEIYQTLYNCILKPDYLISAIGFTSQNLAVYGYLHPHNVIAYSFLGTGVIGMLIFISSLVFFAYKYLYVYFSSFSIKKKYLLVILSSVFIHSMVSGIYITPIFSLIFFYFLLSLNKNFLQNSKTERKKAVNIMLNLFIASGLTISSIYLIKESLDSKKKYDDMPIVIGEKKARMPGIFIYRNTIFLETE